MIKTVLRLLFLFVFASIAICALQQLFVPSADDETYSDSITNKTEAATIPDLLAMKIPSPTVTEVNFPEFSYKAAFPKSTGKAKITISGFKESPDIAKRTKLPDTDPQWLPPVSKRLPINPAVIVGPDGIGNYGGEWHQCSASSGHLYTKIASESFVRFDPSGNIQPALAYKWEISKDNKIFTFYLRKGHKWSDGHPFTTDDLLWVFNTSIGSPVWPSAPDWMNPADGSSLLYIDDITDWGKFIEIFANADKNSLAGHITDMLPAKTVSIIKETATVGKEINTRQKKTIISHINKIFQNGNFYSQKWFSALDLDGEIKSLVGKGIGNLTTNEKWRLHLLLERNSLLKNSENITSIQKSRLNLLLFRKAFEYVVKPAAKSQVKIEAVKDENGDSSHIIRFTFKEPNAIFLQQTATYMFYRGIFTSPAHFIRKYHVDGTNRFTETDIINTTKIINELTACKPVWENLSSELKLKVKSAEVGAIAQELVKAINHMCTKKDFYKPEYWEGINLNSELSELIKTGYHKFGYAQWKRFDELVERQQFLAQIKEKGINTLGQEQLFRFNIAMLRELFSKEAIAYNREAGLNYAAQNGAKRYTNWAARYNSNGSYDRILNPHKPVLNAWRIVSEPIEKTTVFIRNPYYYKVDAEGNQLPYIDKVVIEHESDKQVRLLKMRSGSIDFQTRNINFEDFTVLKQHEKQGNYQIRLWPNDYSGEVNFYLLQTHKNPKYRKLFTDAKFHYALSMAINRQEIIDVVYKGMGRPSGFAVPEGSKYYIPELMTAHTEYSPERANELLDEIGMDKKNADGIRCFPDGTPLLIDINNTDMVPYQVVQMVCSFWQKLGINAQIKARAGGLLNRMINMGIADVYIQWEGGNYFGPLNAGSFAPTHPAESRHWYQWISYLYTGGRSGEEPPEKFDAMIEKWQQVIHATDEKQMLTSWKELIDIFVKELPAIGIMTSPGQVVLVSNGFMNVPQKALSGWIAHQPANCCPESFFFSRKRLEHNRQETK